MAAPRVSGAVGPETVLVAPFLQTLVTGVCVWGGELIPVCGSPPLPRLDRWGPGRARGRCPGSKVCSLKISPTENDNEMRGLTSERGRAGGRNGRRSLGGGGTEAPDRLKLEGRWREDVLFLSKFHEKLFVISSREMQRQMWGKPL